MSEAANVDARVLLLRKWGSERKKREGVTDRMRGKFFERIDFCDGDLELVDREVGCSSG